MNREEIKEFLPHREPMLLVDDITLDGEWADAHYHVSGEEFFLKGHFPGNPVVPGVITCEIIAQSCALLLGDLLKGRTPFYAGIDNVKSRSSAACWYLPRPRLSSTTASAARATSRSCS